jgi:hypothetical protein
MHKVVGVYPLASSMVESQNRRLIGLGSQAVSA